MNLTFTAYTCLIILITTICLAFLIVVNSVSKIKVLKETHESHSREIFFETQRARVTGLEEAFTNFLHENADATLDYLKMAREQFEDMYGLQKSDEPDVEVPEE